MKKLFCIAALFSLGLSMLSSCGNNDTLSLKDAKIEGELSEYLSFAEETAKVDIMSEVPLSVIDEEHSGIGANFITINLPVKIIKKIDDDNLEIKATVKTKSSTYNFYAPYTSGYFGFTSEDKSEYEKFLASPVGTVGTIKLRTSVKLSGIVDPDKQKEFGLDKRNEICNDGVLTLSIF